VTGVQTCALPICVRRIDAEYYQPIFLENAVTLSGCPTLDSISKRVTDFGAYSQFNFIEYAKHGVRFLRNQDIGEVLIRENEPIHITKKAYELLSLKLENGDIVIPRVGTLGKAAVITRNHLPCSANQNLAQIKLKRGLSPFWVAVFLSTKYGLHQILRYSTGNVQPWLNLKQIKHLRVFLTAEKEIEAKVVKKAMKSVEVYGVSMQLYSQAENILLEELGLIDFKPKHELSYTANLSKASGAHRVDAEYFQPTYEALLKKIEVFESSKLGQIAERVLTKVKPDPAQIYKYIEISDIDVAIGETNYTERLGKELPPNARIPINGGELIISKVRPTRGAISIIPKELDTGVICSSAFSVFRTESPLKEYLYMVSRSVVGRLQMERPTTGTSYPTIDDRDIENMEIPLLPPQTQQKIASLVRESHEARKKARELLEQAKSTVEQAIETASGYF